MKIASNFDVRDAELFEGIEAPVQKFDDRTTEADAKLFRKKDNSWKRHQKAPKRFGSTDKIQNHLEDETVTFSSF